MAIDRDKVMRALDIAEEMEGASIVEVFRYNDKSAATIEVRAWGENHKKNIDIALKFCDRLKRKTPDDRGGIDLEGDADGVSIRLYNGDRCKVTYKEIEEPEMAPTGLLVKKKVPVLDCKEGDVVAEKNEADAPDRNAGQGGD